MSTETSMKESESTLQKILELADIQINGDRDWDMRLHHADCARRILKEGSLGLGESYMEGWWDAPALDVFFERLLTADLDRKAREPCRLLALLKARLLNLQSPWRSKRVAESHYNLGNSFYEDMLDPWMQYTCGYWKDADDLQAAQAAKLDLVCRKLHLREGHRVLELGGGWGGFARFAAERYGASVVSYNISAEQVKFARTRCKGLPVEIRQEDYRKASGQFDRAVSIGICEHIGVKNFRNFFALQRSCVKKDGLILTHTIGSLKTKTTSDPWFVKYIFPGGLLPSQPQLTQATEKLLVLEDLHNIGAYYDPTLMEWYRNFDANWHKYRDAFGDNFYRMWKYYLLSCAGAFRARSLQLWQMVFSPSGVKGGYDPAR